jgi:HD-like signal output (HDOD) protein
MLGWFKKDNAPESPAAKPAAAADQNAGAATMVIEPIKRVEPAMQQEIELAAEFLEGVKDCRKKFSDPSFDLPTLPASAMKITMLLQEPDVTVRTVSEAVGNDPVMTAKFLRIANSPMYGGTRKIDSVQVAVQRLGMAMVKSVVLAISLNSTIIREKRLGQRALELWDHSMSTALAGQFLAKRLGIDQPSAFTFGLMHDIGKLAAWLLMIRMTVNKPEVRPKLMESLVEDTHAEVGETLVDVWGMPFEVKAICGGHHKVQTLGEAEKFILERKADIPQEGAKALAKQLGCVILSDRALAALGLARESGDLTIGGSSLAEELGLPQKDTLEFLGELPAKLKENKDM